MSYDSSRIERVQFSATAFTADKTFYHRGPAGKKGRLINFGMLNPSVTFTTTTTAAIMTVGTGGNAAYGAAFNLGALAADAGTKSVRQTYGTPAGWEAIVLPGVSIPADTVISIKVAAPTGGTPAGTGQAFAEFQWED